MLSSKRLKSLIQSEIPAGAPCISIYLPTHARYPDNEGDPVRYKNLVSDAERIAEAKYARRHWEDAFISLYDLVKAKTTLWQYTKAGLAVFACGSSLEVFHLEYAPEPIAIVGSVYHVLPLFAHLGRRADVLLADLSKDRVRLYKASRYGYEPFETDEVKTEFQALFDDFDANADLNVGSYSGLEGMHHGHRAKPEEVEKNREKYFRYLDTTLPQVLGNRKVLLAGTTKNIAVFRQISKNTVYLESQIEQPLDSIDEKDRQGRIAEALEPLLADDAKRLQDDLLRAIADRRTVNEHDIALKAAEEGRLGAIYVNLAKHKAGNTNLDSVIIKGLHTGADVHVLELSEDVRGEWYGVLRY